jgi:DNA polymerase-3 subunit delta'
VAKRARSEEIEETDRLEGFPHPREIFRFFGNAEALARASRAVRSGRPPQGWLITGPPGVGKATLAYRVARYLLRYGATEQGPEDLAIDPSDAVSKQVTAGAHPGLRTLKRGINPKTGKLMTETSVDVIRHLAGFFGMTSGAGGWRIAIIDTADEMSDEAANALLKALEEPPSRAMLMLLSNTPGKLLPTLRSRCQRLDLRPLSEQDVAAGLAAYLPQAKENDRAALAKLSGGSIGAALPLADEGGMALAREAERIVEHAAKPDIAALLALGDRVRKPDDLSAFGDLLVQALTDRVRDRARSGRSIQFRAWIEAWEKIRQTFIDAETLHLEPRQTILSSVMAVSEAARRNPL